MGFVSLLNGPVNDSVTLCHFLSSPEMRTFSDFVVGDTVPMTGDGTTSGANEGFFIGAEDGVDVTGDEVGSIVGSCEKSCPVGTFVGN